MKKVIILLFALLLFSTVVLADEILINSRDWKDVYSGMQYGYISGKQPRFLVSEAHSTLLMNDLNKDTNIEIFSSKKSPFVIGYESLIKSRGFTAVETSSLSLSIELAKKLDVKNFIIVDDSYGYNAIAVAPYAILSSSYVLFADRDNINEIQDFLDKRTVDNILIYGHVDREVRDALNRYNPEIINKDGDRFANNVEIVKKYKEIKDAKQVILTNGEFIEAEIMAGEEPVLFIGSQNVPEKIREYIVSSNIEVGVLIGNELVGTATIVRRQTGISTFVKFARSAREPSGPISQVEGLDIFRLPKYELNISVVYVRYNSITRQLEITIKNNAGLASYFKGTYTIKSGDNEWTVGDLEPVFIDGDDFKTIVYDIEPIIGDEELTADVFVLYGESKDALEKVYQGTLPVEVVEISDDSAITIEKVEYLKSKEQLLVYLKNIGGLDVYVDTEAVDIIVMDEVQTFGAEEIVKIVVDGKKKSVIKVSLSDEDLERNKKVKIRAYYGQRENVLAKVIEGEFDLNVIAFDIMTYLPLAIIILLLFLILFTRRKKKKEQHQQ